MKKNKFKLKNQYKKLLNEIGAIPTGSMNLRNFNKNYDDEILSVFPGSDTSSTNTLFQVFFPNDIPSEELKGKTFIYDFEGMNQNTKINDIKTIKGKLKYEVKIDGNKRIGQEIQNILSKKPTVTGKNSNTIVNNLFKRAAFESLKQYFVCISMMPKIEEQNNDDFIRSKIPFLANCLKHNFDKEIDILKKSAKKQESYKAYLKSANNSEDIYVAPPCKSYGQSNRPITLNLKNPDWLDAAKHLINNYWLNEEVSLLDEDGNTISSKQIRSEIYNYISSPQNPEKQSLRVIQNAINFYTSENLIVVEKLLKNKEEISKHIRKKYRNIDELIKDFNKSKIIKQTIDFTPSDRIGRGEVSLHLFSDTLNPCLNIEPDAIINFDNGKAFCSMKSFRKGEGLALTGTNVKYDLSKFLGLIYDNYNIEQFEKKFNTAKINKILVQDLKIDQSLTESTHKHLNTLITNDLSSEESDVNKAHAYISDIIKAANNSKYKEEFVFSKLGYEIKLNSEKNKVDSIKNYENGADYLKRLQSAYDDLKREMIGEHNVKYVICLDNNPAEGQDWFYVEVSSVKANQICLSGISGGRAAFRILKDKNNNDGLFKFEKTIRELCTFKDNKKVDVEKLYNEEYEEELNNTGKKPIEISSFFRRGKVLKEVYSNLFEGGLGGHMSHPYEVLDKTPEELIERIKEYGVPQKIIEKVDGQNLFFTITKEGQVMFARNSNDMTYDDLIEKFTNHGAEKPFVQGGTAIKRAVDDWVSSNPGFTLNDIETIFHPAEGSNERYQSFINFEIMHPESPNQIEYDKKYIVFHSIIDFEYDQSGKRSEVMGSNSDQRLQKLFNSLKSHIAQYDFELASNREVEINALTSVQISDYIEKINEVADALGITGDETLEEGVISHISNKLKQSGVNLDYNSSKVLFDFVLYGEDSKGTKITGRAITKGLDKEVAKVLRELGLTNKSKAAAMISRILSPFKGIFVDLGIDLLKGVKSAYMSRETGEKNIRDITEKLRLAISDYENYMTNTPEDEITNTAKRLQPYVDKIKQIGIDNAIASPVEGGVYSVNSDLEKITGGFAPMNQILGAAYRDRENIFPEFQDQYLQKESKNSLKKVFSSIF